MPKKSKKSKTKETVRKVQRSESVGPLSWMMGGEVSRAQIKRMAQEHPRKHREAANLNHLLRVCRGYKCQVSGRTQPRALASLLRVSGGTRGKMQKS